MKQCRIRWWHAGGLHVHVAHPDGSYSHYIFPKHEYWRVDHIVADEIRQHGQQNVQVSP